MTNEQHNKFKKDREKAFRALNDLHIGEEYQKEYNAIYRALKEHYDLQEIIKCNDLYIEDLQRRLGIYRD